MATSTADTKMFKSVSNRAEDLPGGRQLAPGEFVRLDPDDEYTKMLVDEGRLVEMPPEEPSDEADKGKKGA